MRPIEQIVAFNNVACCPETNDVSTEDFAVTKKEAIRAYQGWIFCHARGGLDFYEDPDHYYYCELCRNELIEHREIVKKLLGESDGKDL